MADVALAEQLVYTNVSANYSPSGRRGYQTVCSSAGLSRDDCRAVEQVVGGLPRIAPGVARWQWFRLTGERWVLTRSQYFPTDAEVSDPRGAFLAHAIVLSRGEAEASGGNPFGFMDGISFVRSPGEMVNRFGARNGVIPPAEVIAAPAAPDIDGWSGPALLALVGLAADAENLAREGRSLLIQGAPSQVEAVLRLVLHLTPAKWREFCTFDTVVDVSVCRPGQFWAVGGISRRADTGSYLVIEAEQRKVVSAGRQPVSFQSSLYARWLHEQLQGGSDQLAACVRLAPTTHGLLHSIESGDPLPTSMELNLEACASVEKFAGQQMRLRLARRLSDLVAAEVGGPLGSWLPERLTAEERMGLAVGRIPASERAAAWIFNWLLDTSPHLTSSAVASLLALAAHEHHAGLALLATLCGSGRRDSRDRALAEIEARDFERVLTLCPHRISPRDLATVRHAGLLLGWLAKAEIQDHAFLEGLIALVKAGYRGPFAAVLPRAMKLGRGSLRRLLRSPGNPWIGDPQFLDALVHEYRAREQAEPWWNRSVPWPRCPRAQDRDSLNQIRVSDVDESAS